MVNIYLGGGEASSVPLFLLWVPFWTAQLRVEFFLRLQVNLKKPITHMPTLPYPASGETRPPLQPVTRRPAEGSPYPGTCAGQDSYSIILLSRRSISLRMNNPEMQRKKPDSTSVFSNPESVCTLKLAIPSASWLIQQKISGGKYYV